MHQMHLEYFITDFDYHLKLWRNNLDSLQTFLLSCACRKNMISPYSPAQIGNQVPSNILATRQQFQRESKIVLDYLKDSHHARKLSHMQVNYPSTVSNLGRLSGRESARTEPQVRRAESKYHDLETIRYKEFVNTLQANISREFEINQKKRAFNRSVGTKSVAYEIVKGTSPIKKEYFFPHKASHQQILALTGSLSMSDPNIIPSATAAGKKWLGDDKGWS